MRCHLSIRLRPATWAGLLALGLLAGCGGGAADSEASAAAATGTERPPLATQKPGDTTAPLVASTYYVDAANGSDTNNGLRATVGSGGAGPWRTLARVASATINAGDTVRLACGQAWRETLSLGSSGQPSRPITVSSNPAGCSNPPAIDGSTTLQPSAWTLHQGSIYKAALPSAPLQVFSSTGAMTQAHHPNAGFDTTQPTSVYLRNAAASDNVLVNGRNVSTYLTTGSDLVLPAGASLQAGTKLRIRTAAWLMDERSVSAVSGTKLTLDSPTSYPLAAGWGYFLLGQLWMLDSAGEWHYDAAGKQLYAWMPNSQPPSAAVQVTQLATGVDLASRYYVTLDNLVVRKVALGLDLRQATGITVRNSRIEDTVGYGIDAGSSKSLTLSNNSFARTGSDAISGQTDSVAASTGMQVLNNSIVDSGVTMNGNTVLSLPVGSRAAVRAGTTALVEGNTVTNSGYIGIWAGAGSTVRGNTVGGACTVLDDCGAIYTSGTANNSLITGNVVLGARGAPAGKAAGQPATQAQGIYLDESAAGVTVSGNTVTGTDNGIQLHVAANNTLSNNKLYGNRASQLWMQEQRNVVNPAGDVFGNVVSGNQVVATGGDAKGVFLDTVFGETAHFGSFDTNRYLDTLYPVMAVERTAAGRTDHNFNSWRSASNAGVPRNLDANGSATSQTRYASVLPNGANVVPNGNLASSAAGWTAWNATAPLGTLSRTACTPGWCARYVAGGSPGIVSSPNFSVVAGTWYRLSVDVATGANGQMVNLVVRRGGGGSNGYESLADRSLDFTAGTGWKRYSLLFVATKTVNAGDPLTLDLGARVDVQNIASGQSILLSNLELVPIVQPDTFTRSDLLLNGGATAVQLACPVAATLPAQCANYVRLSDDQPVAWPYTVAARSAEIVYTRDARLLDSDGDGIPDQQDACPATPAGAGVNSRGCALGQ